MADCRAFTYINVYIFFLTEVEEEGKKVEVEKDRLVHCLAGNAALER